jgi:hypothetical protein
MKPDPFTTLRRIVHGGITPGQAQDLARACLVAHGVDLSPVTYHPQIANAPAPQPDFVDGESPPAVSNPRQRLTLAAHHVAVLPEEDPNGQQ